MRISTITMFEQSLNSLAIQQGQFLKIGQQIASGQRVMNPSDDPQAAALAVSVSQSIAVNQQYADARITARNALGQEESVLNSIANAISSARTLLVQAANGTLSDADRSSVASELSGIYEALIGQANAADGNGRYLFGGYKDNQPPFVKDVNGKIQYQGDAGIIAQKIDAARFMPSTDNGLTIFKTVHSSAGFIARESGAGAGGVAQGNMTFDGPRVVDSNAPGFGVSFSVKFSIDATTGDITYSTDGGITSFPYEAEKTLTNGFNGMAFTFKGQPAPGDTLNVSRAIDADPDLFRAFEDVIAALNTPAASPEAGARLRNALNLSMREMDNALDNVLTVRASVGARLNELDVVDVVGDNRAMNYTKTLSDLVDLDYNKAISEYALRQVGLQAAQKSFLDIQKLSLFDRM